MSGQSSGSSASSASGVTPNANDFHSSRHDQATREPETEAPVIATLAHHESLQRRHKPRSSGGFLLQTAPAPTSGTVSTNTGPDNTRDVKGKRKAEEGDLLVPKRASARQRHRQRVSLGGSPLATEVVNVHTLDRTENHGTSERVNHSSVPSSTRQSMRSSLNSNNTSVGSASGANPVLLSNERSAIGHDTDPAQIVNLALNLSENRRRNFSSISGGLLISRDAIGARRITSPGQQTLGLPNSVSGGSLRHQLQHQRQVSRNVSPRSGRSGSSFGNKGSVPDSPQSQNEAVGKRQSRLLPDLDTGVAEDVVFNASDATFSRAEKAKLALELMYEYRRLLQYLPPIPASSNNKTAMSKGAARQQAEPSSGLGRPYNPLQYIRNRKVRFRERRPLDPEAGGWKDLDRVRIWVDTVAVERGDGVSHIDRRFPLPPLDTMSEEYPVGDVLQSLSEGNSGRPQTKKVGRPRMDWEFAPWDLLADAHWLNQNDNLDHVEDSSGKKIMAGHQSREDFAPRASVESTRSSVRRSGSIAREHASPDRIRALAGHLRKESKDRGRQSLDMHEQRSRVSEDDNSRDRKSRWPKKLVRSRSSSDSEDSHQGSRRRERRGRHFAGSRENFESAALEKHMMDMLAKEVEASRQVDQSLEEDTVSKVDQNSKPYVGSLKEIDGQQEARQRPGTLQRLRTDVPVTDRNRVLARASLDEDRLHRHGLVSDDLDLTAPNSPTASELVPSIAFNLSPPASPPSATTSPKKTLISRMGSSRRDRSESLNRRATGENDPESSGSTDLSRQTTSESQSVNALRKETTAVSSSGLLTPISSETTGNTHRPLDGSSIKSIKNSSGTDSKLRGLFKGGRIAELVGSEVSRVGDMLWRRDSNHTSKVASPASSYAASEESDVDDGDISALESSPKNGLSRATTKDGGGSLSRISTNSEKPKYYMSNLPTFRSSLIRDEQPFKQSKATETSLDQDHDHITRQQLAQRESRRSSRFDRLALPKIDVRSISPDSSREPSPVRSQTRRPYDRDSRQSSSSRSDRGVWSAEKRLNAMLGTPGKAGTGEVAPTGLASLDSRPPTSPNRPDLKGKRQWSISDREVSTIHGTVNKRDVARVRALLLSSGVKANEIARRAEEVPEKLAPFLQELVGLFKGSIPHVPRSQEPLLAARILISNIETSTQKVRDDAEHFNRTTIEGLHDQIKAIGELVTGKLTPLVRASADEADAFSTELTTTHTLAIKQLNDSIDYILRQRRRKFRNMRRLGWATVEWTLLGVMWMVWLVVVIFRLVRGSVGAFVKGLKWLLWL
ncbi:hypothetical protein BDR22DRAFT_893235 [Usnea florida]